MMNTLKIALITCAATLTLAAAPSAQAVAIASNTAAASAAGGTSSTLTKQQLKQQKKLRKKCAKLSSAKLKESKRTALMAMCKPSSTPPGSSGGAGVDTGSNNAGGNSGSNNAGGNSGSNNSGGGPVIDLIVNSPPLFLPTTGGSEKPQGEGGASPPTSQVIVPDTRAVPEPGSLALLGLGLVGLGLARRRERR